MKLYRSVYRPAKTATKRLRNELCLIFGEDNAVLTKKRMRRIRFYILQSFFVSRWMCILKNKKLTSEDKRRLTILGALTPLVDDMTDDLQITSAEIIERLENKDIVVDGCFQIAKYLSSQLFFDDYLFLKKIAIQTLSTQERSIAQLSSAKIHRSEIIEITKNKGGLATYLYWVAANNCCSNNEKKSVLTLGYSLQLLNDIFDVYKDFNNGNQTLFTTTKDINKSIGIYNQVVDDTIDKFISTHYRKNDIKKCLTEITVIWSRGGVCAEQLKKLQQKSRGVFDIHQYARKDLVCDMEKPSNILKMLNYNAELIQRVKNKLTGESTPEN